MNPANKVTPFIPGWIREQGFTTTQLAVYVYIASRGESRASQVTMERDLRSNRPTIRKAIAELKEFGWLESAGRCARGVEKLVARTDGRPVKNHPCKTPGRPVKNHPSTCKESSLRPVKNHPSKVLPESTPLKSPHTTPAMSTNKQPYPLGENPRSGDLLREPTIREKWEARDRAAAEARKGSKVPTMDEVMAAFESGDAQSGLFMAARRMRP